MKLHATARFSRLRTIVYYFLDKINAAATLHSSRECHEMWNVRIILLVLCARQLERSARSIGEVFALWEPRCKAVGP